LIFNHSENVTARGSFESQDFTCPVKNLGDFGKAEIGFGGKQRGRFDEQDLN
jgi:hypothetical protein